MKTLTKPRTVAAAKSESPATSAKLTKAARKAAATKPTAAKFAAGKFAAGKFAAGKPAAGGNDRKAKSFGRGLAPSSRKKDAFPVLGAPPRADLLPPAMRAARAARTVRRSVVAGAIAAILVAAGATVLATGAAADAQAQLATAQARTDQLLAEQSRYAEVRQVGSAISAAKSARAFGAATEIAWKTYVTAIQQTLPAGMTIQSLAADSSSPLTAYPQPTVPLQAARVATITLRAVSKELPAVQQWLDALTTLPGYADAVLGSVKRTDAGVYETAVTLHVNDKAFANRFGNQGAAQ